MNTLTVCRRPNIAAAATVLAVLAGVFGLPLHAFAQLGRLVVTVTNPQSGATVSGTTTVSAQVTLVGAITARGVQFKLDGVNLGPEDTTAPYAVPWNTAMAANGPHTLTAVARDVLGLRWTSDEVTVTVFNDTMPPDVTVTSPAAGATVNGAVTVTASASDNVGVAGVLFLVDGTAIGAEDTTAPYSIAWNTSTAANGAHTLTASARDAAGQAATSAPVTVTVLNDLSAPTITVTSPSGGAMVGGSVTVRASASDDVGVVGVQFFVDGGALGAEDTASPYDIAWDTSTVANGAHTLTARARDAAGRATTSAPVTVTVRNDVSPPTITITSPPGGSTVGGSITVTASASDDVGVVGVQFFVDGGALGAEDAAAPYEVAWDTTTASDGPHTLRAVARDGAGRTTTAADVTVTVANTATTTRIEETGTGVTLTGSWIQGDASRPWSGGTAALGFVAAHVAELRFNGTGVSWIGFRGPQTGIARVLLDGTLRATVDAYAAAEEVRAVLFTIGGLPTAPHVLRIEVTGEKNPQSADRFIVIDAFDVAGSSGSGGGDTTPPTASIVSPASGATVSGTLAVTATASDDVGVAGVQLFVDGAPLGPEDTTAPYSASWNTTTVVDGSHTLTAVARDAAGHTAASMPVTVTVNNAAPPPTATMTRVENTDLSIAYAPGTPAAGQPPDWYHGSRSRGWSDSTAAFNRSAGARATFSFNGTAVSWIGFRAYWAGIARVHLDGAFVTEIDLSLPLCPQPRPAGCVDEEDEAVVFTANGLAPGAHTLTVESTGRKNPEATDYAVVVDAFDVGPSSPPAVIGARAEEAAAAVAYTGAWTQDTGRAWSGGTAAAAATAGARATFAFTGTQFRWVGLRGPAAGIADVFVDGAFHGRVDTYAPAEFQAVVYTILGLAPASHTVTIEATGERNAAASGSAVFVDAFDTRSRFEEQDASVSYTGTWRQDNMDRAWSGTSGNLGSGTAAIASTPDATVEFTFSGIAVSWIGFRGPTAGLADVFVDGTLVRTVDLYSPSEELRAAAFSATGLADGAHVLRIVPTGGRNPSAVGANVVVDAFDVTWSSPAPSISRFEQGDPSIAYSGVWTPSTQNAFYSGRLMTYATTAGARADFTFTGTSVRWIGQRLRHAGIARVSVDGIFVAEIDLYTPIQDQFQAAVFSVSGLAPGGPHTLTIEATGLKNAQSSNTWVVVDAFEVYQP